MTNTIQRVISIPQPREQVWQALTDSATLAEWMFPNDIEPRVGHRFTFQVPPNPKAKFDGLVVHCEVLDCEPPSENAGGEYAGGRIAFSWSAGALVDTRVSFRLEPDGEGTRILFEHSGFDVSLPFGQQAFKGAEFGWTKMLGQLESIIAHLAADAASAPGLFATEIMMTELTKAEMIWNRACGEDPLRILSGDRALADLLSAHSLAMNGGVLHAVECLTAEQLSDAQAGYRFYGLDNVASLLSHARGIFEAEDELGSQERRLDDQYADFIPSDSFLLERFRMRLESSPSDFASIRKQDMERD